MYGHSIEIAAILADWRPKAWAEVLADSTHHGWSTTPAGLNR